MIEVRAGVTGVTAVIIELIRRGGVEEINNGEEGIHCCGNIDD